jgi:hypothetical protein
MDQKLDLSRLLGFDAIASDTTDDVDFRDDVVAARLGAKVGVEPGSSSAETAD